MIDFPCFGFGPNLVWDPFPDNILTRIALISIGLKMAAIYSKETLFPPWRLRQMAYLPELVCAFLP